MAVPEIVVRADQALHRWMSTWVLDFSDPTFTLADMQRRLLILDLPVVGLLALLALLSLFLWRGLPRRVAMAYGMDRVPVAPEEDENVIIKEGGASG